MMALATRRVGPPPPDAADALGPSSRLRFLMIEDSTSDSELVRALLEDEFPNGEIDVAASLELALQHLTGSDYDLVLADLTLPDAEGEVVVRAVREAAPQTALMVLTGRVDGTLALWSLAEGAQDYLVKGVHDGPRLAEALLHGLQRSRTEQMALARLTSALELESEAAEQLRHLDTAKDNFVATASHELRTPLTSIALYAEMLQDDEGLTGHQSECVAAIARNTARLSSLTENLLLLSGLNQVQTATLEVDLGAVISSAQEVIGALGADKHVAVRLELPSDPVLVTGDAGQLERVVVNLMSNAIKYSEEAGRVTCRLTSSSTEAIMAVSDTGIGVPADEQGQLFDRFFRGAQARARAIGGTGLGLHIAGSIVTHHGGDILVESALGHGSTFTVRLPLRPAPTGHPDATIHSLPHTTG